MTALLLVAATASASWVVASSPVRAAATKPIPNPFPGPFTPAIEPYTAYDGQTKCASGAKVGTRAFERMLRRRFPGVSYIGTWRPCVNGSVSEHYEGRAIDWGVNAHNSVHRDHARRLIRRLFKTDWWGNPHAMARRLGIMYIIWNKRMWRSYRPFDGWQPYHGSSPHTDHMHISFARAGGLGLTSYWTGEIGDVPPAWIPGWPPPTPTPTPTPIPTPTPTPTPSTTVSPTT
jgi:hypothetical protein